MSPDTLNNDRTRKNRRRRRGAADQDAVALPLDTTSMTEGQVAALQVAESARDDSAGTASFAERLLLGDFQPAMLLPFPRQSPEDKAIGDELVEAVSTFLAENLDPEEADATRTIPAKVVTGLRRLGLFAMKVPKAYGGLGLSQVNYNRVILAVASYCGSTAVLLSAHQSIGVPNPLKMFGTDEQKQKYFKRLVDGDISAFALTEPDVGSDPARMTTTAKLTDDGKHYMLNGTKLWTTNGPIADLLVVMARTVSDNGDTRPRITAFIVDAKQKGVETVHRCDFMGLRAIHNGVIRFHNVKVPVDDVLWGEGKGLKLALKTLNTGRLTLPAACTGLAKQCLHIARQWGSTRVQWGLPIGEHEAGREKIADIACTTFAMEAVSWLTSHWADQGRDIRIEAAMAKLFASEAAWRVVDTTMQFRGGRGYERASSLKARGEAPFAVERMMRDTRINTIIEGTSDIMRLFLAREALDPHLKLALDVMKPGSPMGARIKGAVGMAGFYGRWYPWQLLRRAMPARTRELGVLAREGRAIDRASHRLATTLFHAMGRHQQKLEREQVLLAHLMDIGTELFAMSATCAYAVTLLGTPECDGSPVDLAREFCRRGRVRVDASFRAIKRGGRKGPNRLAGEVLDGGYRWLEEGIVPGGQAA